MSTLAIHIDEDDLARLEGGAAVSLADPLNNLKVYVCARGAGYVEVDCAQIAVGTDVRTGQKCQFLTIKMMPELLSDSARSAPSKTSAGVETRLSQSTAGDVSAALTTERAE